MLLTTFKGFEFYVVPSEWLHCSAWILPISGWAQDATLTCTHDVIEIKFPASGMMEEVADEGVQNGENVENVEALEDVEEGEKEEGRPA